MQTIENMPSIYMEIIRTDTRIRINALSVSTPSMSWVRVLGRSQPASPGMLFKVCIALTKIKVRKDTDRYHRCRLFVWYMSKQNVSSSSSSAALIKSFEGGSHLQTMNVVVGLWLFSVLAVSKATSASIVRLHANSRDIVNFNICFSCY